MKRIQIVDLIRAVSILGVMASHLAHFGIARANTNSLSIALWAMIKIVGAYGVPMFFVISGFVITRLIAVSPEGLFQPNIGYFYVRRVGRIIPLVLLTLLIGIFLISFVHSSSPAYEVCFRNPQVVFHPAFWMTILTFTFNWYKLRYEQITPDFGLHWDVLWTLSIEEQFYLFYPFLLKKLRNKSNLVLFLAGVIIANPLVYWIGHLMFPDRGRFWLNSFFGFGLIATGCLLYLAVEKFGPLLKNKKSYCVDLAGLGIIIFLVVFSHPPKGDDWAWAILNTPFFGVGMFFFLLGGLHLDLFESKFFTPLAWIGKVSYGGYLFHPMMLFFLWTLLQGKNAFLAFFIYIVATFFVCELSFRFYEVPMNLWVRKIFSARSS